MAVAVLSAVLVSAFLHATWNAMLKRQPDPSTASAGVFVVCGAASAIVALAAGSGFGGGTPVVWSALSGLFEAGYIIALGAALGRAPLGPVYTISRGGALVGVWPLSVVLLGEPITVAAAAGAALVLAGLVCTGLGGSGVGDRRPGGLVAATASAAFIAGYHLCYKQALSTGGAPPAVFAVSLAVAAPLNVARLGAAGRARLRALVRQRPWPIVATGLVSCASFLVFLIALARAGAGAVYTLRNTSILFAQILAFAIGERPTRAGVSGALLVAAGAILLA
jgi:drug/metabolite transporter (DMT)-like permease